MKFIRVHWLNAPGQELYTDFKYDSWYMRENDTICITIGKDESLSQKFIPGGVFWLVEEL